VAIVPQRFGHTHPVPQHPCGYSAATKLTDLIELLAPLDADLRRYRGTLPAAGRRASVPR